jgi:hypothetical protein
MSSIDSPCYALAGFLHKILSPLPGKSEPFVKNSGYFIQLLKLVNLQSPDTLVSFNVVSLFTNVPADEALQVISKDLWNDDTLAERSVLQAEAIMEFMEVCLKTTYFQVDVKFFQQKDGMAMGSYNPSYATFTWNILRNWLLTQLNTSHRYGCSTLMTFVVWPHGPDRLHNFLNHLNSLRPSIQFTMKRELNNTIPFLDVPVIRKEMTLATRVYRKPTHTGRYLNFKS